MREESEPNVGAAEQGAPPTAGTLFSSFHVFSFSSVRRRHPHAPTTKQDSSIIIAESSVDSLILSGNAGKPQLHESSVPISSGLEVIFGYVIFVKT